MNDATHLVVRASAGTGKTFALSNRYLKLLRAGAPPETILATTFTRKAAGEILERVLTRLARGALDERSAAELAKQLGEPSLRVGDFRGMLASVCKSLHRVTIGTIDSFFHRVVQAYRHELGVPAGARVVGPDDPFVAQLRRQAIEAMLGDDPPDVLIDLLRRLHHDSSPRSITEAIDGIVADLYDKFREAPREAWLRLDPPEPLDRKALAAAVAALAEATSGNRIKLLAKGLEGNLRSATAGNWVDFLAKGLSPCVIEDPPMYNRAAIPRDLIDVYEPLLRHADAELIGRLARQNEATLDLLERFDRHYSRLRHTHRVLLFSDLPHKLGRELPERGEEAVTELYYRLDAQVGHLLLDEFQDTSAEQWRVLRPIAEEIRAFADGSRSFFCVGDVKQAIYGWRGGCAEIFDRLESDLGLPGESRKSLGRSHRSSPAVLGAVNRVFAALPDAAPFAEELPAVTEPWREGFKEHTTVHAGRPGYAELITSPAASEEEPQGGDNDGDGAPTAHEHFAAQRIADAARTLPPGMTLGVLVSTNEAVRKLLYLVQAQGIDASGEGVSKVTDDPAVGAVLSALLMADHPGDSASAFHVFNSPLAEVVGLDALTPEAICRVGLAVRRELLALGYGGVLARWAERLAPSCSPRGADRFMQLLELADRYDAQPTLRARDFVAFVEATPVEQPAPGPVRIMTVHRAKGLEFDAVVIPQLDRPLLGTSDLPAYAFRAEPTGPIEAIYRATNDAVRSRCPEIEAAWQQERERRMRDDLCTLYVKMTRPRYALHMIVRPLTRTKGGDIGKKGWTNLSFATLLRRALGPGEPDFAGEETLWSEGDERWFEKVEAPEVEAVEKRERRVLRPRMAEAVGRRVAPARAERKGVAELLALDREPERATELEP